MSAASRAWRGSLAVAVLSALLAVSGCATAPAPLVAAPAAAPGGPIKLRLLAINDFHGNLLPPRGGLRVFEPGRPGPVRTMAAGGAEHLATAVATMRAGQAHTMFVAAGDLVGASPLLSALFNDEPTIEALNLMGLDVAAVGNHEFDKGAAELLRLQRGGCHPTAGCQGRADFAGAKFQYLAASTFDVRTGQTILPPYVVRRFEGVPVAFIGLTLAATPSIVAPAGVAGLRFGDEAETVNALVPELRRQGVGAIVLLIHEGGLPGGGHDECPDIGGPIVDIVKRLDPAVDLVVSGHTHRAYICRIDGRLLTSADQYGTLLTSIDLELDRRSGRVLASRARNLVVGPESFAKDPRLTALIAGYERIVQPLAQRVVGRLAGPLSRDPGANGESALGQVIADAQLAATRDAGAQLALMNPGGVRAALAPGPDGQVRYEDLFAAQPFYNNLVTMTLTGAQLGELLERQWAGQPFPRILHVSAGFTYEWDADAPVGQRVVAASLRLDGAAMQPETRYRVTVNSFLASGGDNFTLLREGTDRRTGVMDVDALEQYLRERPGIGASGGARITRRH